MSATYPAKLRLFHRILYIQWRKDNMQSLGIISGTIFFDDRHLKMSKEEIVETEFGKALVIITENFVYIPRHGNSRNSHVLPHVINNQANLMALKDCGVTEVIGINSTGSLHKTLKPGTLIVPDDFIALSGTPTTVTDKAFHIIPRLNDGIRKKLITAAGSCGIEVVNDGIYWQTRGPRLETKAEIRMMAHYADIVGMTMASEAAVACELDLPYATICSIDNYGHGIVEKPLTIEEITEGARKNTDTILKIIKRYIEG